MNTMKKMSKNNSWSNSSFWLEDDFATSGTSIFDNYNERPKGIDLLKLAGYRRAIGNFVSIVTGETIPVSFSGHDSYTDGKSVNISAKLNDNEFDPAVGLALHEGSHIKLTDFNLLKDLDSKIPEHVYGMVYDKHFADANLLDSNKQWAANFYITSHVKDLLNIVEDRRIDNFIYKTAPGYRGYYEALYDKYFNASIVDKGLNSDEYTEADWDSYMFRICNITNPNRRLDIMNLRTIWNILDLKNIGRLQSTQESLDVAFNIFEFIESQIPKPINKRNAKNGQEGKEGNKDKTGKESKGNGTEDTHNVSDKQFEKILEDIDNQSDDGSKAEGDEAKKSGGKMPRFTPAQLLQLDKAIKKQKDFLNDQIKKTKLSKKDAKAMQAMEESGIEMKEVSFDRELHYGDKLVTKQDVYVIKNVTQSLIDSRQFPDMFSEYSYRKNEQMDAIRAGLVLGKLLGKRLKVRSEQKDTKFIRLRSGKINNRMLASCGYGNESIFEKIESFAYNPGILHISIDNSGSMNGSNLTQSMKTTMAIAKACDMIDNMDVVVSFRSSDNVGGARGLMPVIAIIYDSRKDHISKLVKIMPQVTACGTTPEGLCFQAIMDNIIDASKGKDAYFVNMCDGMPQYENYGGIAAFNHTRLQIKKMKKEGIKVISYFLNNGYGGRSAVEGFEIMYGKDGHFINTNNLVSLAKTMNDKFLEIA
jgi:hypothetical protein